MITLFDLREKENSELIEAIQNLYDEPLNIITLREQSINKCIGCWNCWVKTPGRCVMKDQMADSYNDYVNSDTVVIVMETAQGFINHQAKAFFDRSIPHYHPYIEMVGGECHHVARYERYPDMVFYFDPEGLTDQEEQVTEDYLYRTAYHFRSKAYRIAADGTYKLLSLEPRKAKNGKVAFSSTEPMEKLVIYSGSPRKSRSNTAIIMNKVADILGDRAEIRDLKERGSWDKWAEAFKEEEDVMFFMPLYVHAMPSHVMEFIEKLQPFKGSISFFVQSGFPESSQSYYLEAYFEQLALRLGRTYLGTAIKGGVEGMQMRPVKARGKMVEPMAKAIVNLVRQGKFSQADIKKLAIPVRFGMIVIVIFKLLSRTGLVKAMWDKQLKENGAYEKRFDRPEMTTERVSLDD